MPSPKRVLLLDDDIMLRSSLSEQLASEDAYSVVEASTCAEARDKARDGIYEFMILDVGLPDGDGRALCRDFREDGVSCPIILLTAADTDDDTIEGLESGANDYITKPVDFAVAMARIETRLSLAATIREQHHAAELYRLASNAADEGLWDWDMLHRNLDCSAGWKSILGYSEEEFGCDIEQWFALIHPADRARWRRELEAHLEGRTPTLESEYRIRHKDGRYRWVECRGRASRDGSGTAVRLAGHMTDITSRKTIDAVTLLPNRVWLESELEAMPHESDPAALLLLEVDELDRFRQSLSQEGCRSLLEAVASRLAEAMRALSLTGLAELACATEGQFAVLFRRCVALENLQRWAGGLHSSLDKPFAPEGEAAFVSACIGIAVAPAGRARDGLLRNAQAALRHAREQGKGRTAFFQEAMRQHDLEELRLEADLRRGVERQEFVVHYQPKVDLEDGAIHGFEALVRWNRPGHGLVMPNDFIPIAERRGLIVPIGQFVLQRACTETATLRRSFPLASVSVNVSGRQFSEPDLVEQVLQALRDAALDPPALRLEVTETAVLVDAAASLATMQQLRRIGVGLKLDDFGAGYASLAYLQQFPFDTLKIDRSFVMAMDDNPEGLALVRAMIELARSLHLNVVAEGIENRKQAELLRAMGCRYGQGYWFSRPVELASLKELLAGWKLPAAAAVRRPRVAPKVLAYE